MLNTTLNPPNVNEGTGTPKPAVDATPSTAPERPPADLPAGPPVTFVYKEIPADQGFGHAMEKSCHLVVEECLALLEELASST